MPIPIQEFTRFEKFVKHIVKVEKSKSVNVVVISGHGAKANSKEIYIGENIDTYHAGFLEYESVIKAWLFHGYTRDKKGYLYHNGKITNGTMGLYMVALHEVGHVIVPQFKHNQNYTAWLEYLISKYTFDMYMDSEIKKNDWRNLL